MKNVGRRSRLAIGLRVVLAVALALVGTVLAIDLAESKYVRIDLSQSGRNTLDDAVLDLVDGLPEPMVVDVFFRPLDGVYYPVSVQAQNRMLELLVVAHNARRNHFDVRVHDPARFEDNKERQLELGVEGENIVVYSCGDRKAVQRLFGEIAVIDWGNPTAEQYGYLTKKGIAGIVDPRRWDPNKFRPAQLSIFRGEEAIAQALLRVSSGTAPRAYFSAGQGEPDIDGTLVTDLGKLRRFLERDGFEVAEWDATEEPDVPADCEVLALIGATQPFPPEVLDRIEAYVKRGGRIVAAPDLGQVESGAQGGIVELLGRFGMHAVPGRVCEAVVGQGGQTVEGVVQCSVLLIDERGLNRSLSITEPLVRRGRRVQFTQAPAFDKPQGFAAGGRLVHTVISTTPEAWRDLPLPGYDYRYDRLSEERGRFPLGMLAEISVPTAGGDASLKKGYVLGLSAASFAFDGLHEVNRDFLLNAFNFLTEREHRVRVTPLARGISQLDLERGAARPVLTYGLWIVLPAIAIAIGAVLGWRRRR